jgi:hypothetical protein
VPGSCNSAAFILRDAPSALLRMRVTVEGRSAPQDEGGT